jgi:hypothetical protein
MNLQIVELETEKITWENLIPPQHWTVYKRVLDRLCHAAVPFALGGGLAVGVYTGKLRRSKDLDIYILPEHREALMGIMADCGLIDYHDQVPYDRGWIYRGHREGVIVDAIWAMANKRAQVDSEWLERGPVVTMFHQQFRVIPAEELIWSKLYVLQRDRCDWPDILNLIYATGPTLDWEHLLNRVGEDRPLVKGVLSVFSWLSPARAGEIPRPVWRSLGLPAPKQDAATGHPNRKDLLDTRPWLFTEAQYSAA